MLYLIVILFILFGIYRYDYRQVEKGKLLYWSLLLIMLICIAGFRYRMGVDSIVYEVYYTHKTNPLSHLKAIDFSESRFAPAFVLLMSLCKSITDDFMLLQFVVATIVNCSIFYFFWKNTRHIFFAALLYFFILYFNLNMEVLREAIAVSIFLLSWPFFRDGKWLWYYLFALFAFSWHVSAAFLFLLPLTQIPGINWLFRFNIRTFVIGGILLGLSLVVMQQFYTLMQYLSLNDSMAERAQAYSNNSLGGARFNIFGIISQIIKYVLYPSLAMYFLNKNPETLESNDMRKKENLSVANIYISLMSAGLYILVRYNNYLLFFSIILISDWLFSVIRFNLQKIRLNPAIWAAIFLPLFITVFSTFYMAGANKEGTLKTYMMYYPYTDGFNKELVAEREKIILIFRRGI